MVKCAVGDVSLSGVSILKAQCLSTTGVFRTEGFVPFCNVLCFFHCVNFNGGKKWVVTVDCRQMSHRLSATLNVARNGKKKKCYSLVNKKTSVLLCVCTCVCLLLCDSVCQTATNRTHLATCDVTWGRAQTPQKTPHTHTQTYLLSHTLTGHSVTQRNFSSILVLSCYWKTFSCFESQHVLR